MTTMTNPSSHPPPTRPPLPPPPPRRPFSPLRQPRPPTTIKHLRHRRRPSNGRPPARARRRNRGPTAPRATTTASCSARTTSKRARRNPGMIFSVVESFLDLLRSIIFPKPGHLIGLARLGQENQKKVSWKSFCKVSQKGKDSVIFHDANVHHDSGRERAKTPFRSPRRPPPLRSRRSLPRRRTPRGSAPTAASTWPTSSTAPSSSRPCGRRRRPSDTPTSPSRGSPRATRSRRQVNG